MIFGGMSLLWFNRPSVQASLMTCVGLGLVLVCFGTKAGGTWSGWSATGAGAMAVLLFGLLGSGLIDQSQKATAAATQIAEK
jgi:hypothetical protein